MKYFMLCSIISMNLFIVVSTLFKETFHIPIEPLYYPTMVIIAIITILYALVDIIKTLKIPMGFALLILIVVLMFIAFVISPHNNEKLSENNIRFFVMWSIPAAICGVYIKYLSKSLVEKFFKWVFILFSFTFLCVILIPYLIDKLPGYIDFGLMNYQNASYLSAFTVGLGIYIILKVQVRFRIFYIVMTALTLPSVFIPGGRGGAILLILYFLITLIILTFKRELPAIFKILIYMIASVAAFSLIAFIYKSGGDSRTFSYIKGGSFDVGGTSGRGPIYEMSMYYISRKPMLGYGPFNYYHLIHNIPHNMILEMLLSFGIIGLLVISFILLLLVINLIKNYDPNSLDLLVLFITIYPVTLLMFSSNYLVTSELWFILFYFITKGRRKNV
ncbi:O-antigen ligase family protein [Staphylococcus petrasii]|uniref:O-antigen ligase family protein n=1 Tax=Staphylococcus petrasii TaxID=1276936 RepID=UPI000CD0D3DE|nr:O-antigen ligase family protein [Staphylococcus petrasii]PNZ80415.1 capsular biosynthesis protein [Staphylococcus petrasii]TGA81522.1 O-antigen ligase family protein [Staphylococcus petrasii]SUM59004.1 Capsular polysaccharide synthesis enzyme Cap5J [Staphylococcus petrasii]